MTQPDRWAITVLLMLCFAGQAVITMLESSVIQRKLDTINKKLDALEPHPGSTSSAADFLQETWSLEDTSIPMPTHESDPSKCIVGQLYENTSDPTHKVRKVCVAPDTWKVVEEKKQ